MKLWSIQLISDVAILISKNSSNYHDLFHFHDIIDISNLVIFIIKCLCNNLRSHSKQIDISRFQKAESLCDRSAYPIKKSTSAVIKVFAFHNNHKKSLTQISFEILICHD